MLACPGLRQADAYPQLQLFVDRSQKALLVVLRQRTQSVIIEPLEIKGDRIASYLMFFDHEPRGHSTPSTVNRRVVTSK